MCASSLSCATLNYEKWGKMKTKVSASIHTNTIDLMATVKLEGSIISMESIKKVFSSFRDMLAAMEAAEGRSFEK